MIEMWRRSWDEFTPFLAFPIEVRTIIYTTNAIESLNARFRAATRRRGSFPDEQSALKVLYLAVNSGDAAREEQTQPDWPDQRLEERAQRVVHDLRRRLGMRWPDAPTQSF